MQLNKKKKNSYRYKIIFLSFIFCFAFAGSYAISNVHAQTSAGGGAGSINTSDKVTQKQIELDKKNTTYWERAKAALYKASSKALNSAIRNALNTIAYDTATWIGSGRQGQKPQFMTEGWGTYLENVADNAAGTFIEELGKNGPTKFNLCEPNFDVTFRIGLGLVQYQRPKAPACSFTKMANNWKTAADKWKDMSSADYLKKASGMFDPASNDVGIAMSLQTGVIENIEKQKTAYEKDRNEGNGWLEFNSLSGIREAAPGNAAAQADMSAQLMTQNLAMYTGDALIDASNVFLNQLALTAFNKFMQRLGKDKEQFTSSYSGDFGGLGDPANNLNSGEAGMKDSAQALLEPNFTVRADYDILSELSLCQDPTKAGPTNCVITDRFVQAVTERKTVGEAMTQGYLNKQGVFGFFKDGTEPKYADESYPYRSMIILRKYRIIPAGWEVASQYIKANANTTLENMTLEKLVACFDENDDYAGYSESWCRGLVDPNWVLKAPLNYCRRQGFGPEIQSESVVGDGNDSEVMISRSDEYCADEQSCINELNDGSCQAYGYCVKERRKWDFNSDSCDAKYNTCQTFKTSDGKTASYLENTLDYSGCSAENAGCAAYATEYDFATSKWEDAGEKIYFDKNVTTCEADKEGCHEFVRTKPGVGANLLENSGFEDDLAGTIWDNAGTRTDDPYEGIYSLVIGQPGNRSLVKDITVGPADFNVAGERFALSFYAKNCTPDATFGIKHNSNTLSTLSSNGWTRNDFVFVYPSESASSNKVTIEINNASDNCEIDSIKLERGGQPSDYSGYRTDGVVYEKLLPYYLSGGTANDNTCYDSRGALKAGAPAECSKFVRTCTVDEVNCEMYTSVTDGVGIPGKVTAQDYCAGECVGFDTYVQQGTTFDTSRYSYFIPSSASTCGAESVGCEEFTNLDSITKGGEGIEYYSFLKQCIKPDADKCGEFYAWEGSDETGYQLKVMQLEKNGNEPKSTDSAADAIECTADIYNLPSTETSANPDCRQFYDKSGTISYHLMTKTITCSDDCFAYRETRKNVDPNLTINDCDGNDMHWDAAGGGQCYKCENGGTWDPQQNACVYKAIPGEGTTCTAQANGCREYSGNTGNNMSIVLNNDFEGSLQNWTAGPGAFASSSNDSLLVGGRSLAISGGTRSASVSLGATVLKNKSYVLSYIAKGKSLNVSLSAMIGNTSPASTAFSGSSILSQSEWKKFEMNIASLDHDVLGNESLAIIGTGDFFIDDIRLTEITDRFYLIRDSWVTPEICNLDENGNPFPLFALGCDAYADRDNNTHYLHSFNHLCQDSAVGCELMIDTQNSSDYRQSVSSDVPAVTTPADKFAYVVFDKAKQCSAIDKGCERLGKAYKYDDYSSIYSDKYLVNDPDKYSSILCGSDAVNCGEWQTSDGNAYFRNPGDQACEWRQGAGQSNGWKWYKKRVKKCATQSGSAFTFTNKLCLANSDCTATGETCQTETADDVCPASALKTFGEGGAPIYQPDTNASGYWAGLCPASEAGCTEYVDPVSKFSNNMEVKGKAKLMPDTLYVLSSGSEINSCTDERTGANFNKLYVLLSDNQLGNAVSAITATVGSERFYAGDNRNNLICSVSGDVRKAAVEYRKRQDIDFKTCNGMVDFEKGCVLFNERSQDGGSGLIDLADAYDADLTLVDGNGISPRSNNNDDLNNANKVIKVTPDRECGEWLACERSVPDNSKEGSVCEKIGICNKFDDNGGCERFVTGINPTNQTYPQNVTADSIFNMSGYVKVGNNALGGSNNAVSVYPNDYYQFETASSTGLMTGISNGGFESARDYSATAGNDPIMIPSRGWQCDDYAKCEVITNPVAIQIEKVCYKEEDENCVQYAPEGRNILKLSADHGMSYMVYTKDGEQVSVMGSSDYMLTAYVDTRKLSDGKAVIKIEEFKNGALNASGTPQVVSNGYVIGSNAGNNINEVSKAKTWTPILAKFSTKSATKNIKIYLTTEADILLPQGDVFFDEIAIRPALASRNNWYTAQTCRLYPSEDSLTCDYYESSGIRRKGWYGYCLEHDRYPGNPDACLLWWPVPNNTYKVNAVCGDGYANGNEDCDCPPASINPWVSRNSCSSLDTVLNTPAYPYPYQPFGTNGYNQYKCGSCLWSDGWCGDKTIQTSYGEHCDWNDLGTGVNTDGKTCQSGVYEEYNHDGYTGYLYNITGNPYKLGCYDNSGYLGDSTKRCTFDLANCSDVLGTSDLAITNNDYQHTRKECEDAGGQVMDADGYLIMGNGTGGGSFNKPPYFCKFGGNVTSVDNTTTREECLTTFTDGATTCADSGGIVKGYSPATTTSPITLLRLMTPAEIAGDETATSGDYYINNNASTTVFNAIKCDKSGMISSLCANCRFATVSCSNVPVVETTYAGAVSSCGSIAGGGGGWKPYKSGSDPDAWTETKGYICIGGSAGSGCNGSTVPTGEHIFGPTPTGGPGNYPLPVELVEASHAYWKNGRCKHNGKLCSATVVSVGCY